MEEAVPALESWCVYDHPSDFPNHFVARLFIGTKPTTTCSISRDITTLRRRLAEMQLVCVPRFEFDDPVIVEVWL